MAGLIKAKKYDWKDSNMALFGSDTERQVKKESAMTEPAWQGAGTEPGLKIWRIVKFEVTDWPVEDYGKFFTGDSYIILKTYKEGDSEDLKYDLHFWIGTQSTQDEYGTAAYKTVELDTYLDDKAVQHREVQGHESVFVPFYKGDTMKMVPLYSWQDYERMPETAWKIKQPEDGETRLDAFSLGGIEVLVCPGLAFGQNCSRLGRGKGYYDKYIETCQQKGSYPFMVGLAFDEQMTKGDLVLDENDQYLSVVLYPSMHRYEPPSGQKEKKTFMERNLTYTFPY